MTWELTPLKKITTKIGSGATPRGGNNSYKTEGITLIRSLNVYDFEFSYEGLAFINEEQASETRLARVIVESKDILLNITGASVARCCIVPEHLLPARVNQHVSLVRVDPNLADSHYVLYCINSPVYKHQLLTLAQGGATREALTQEIIGNLEIPLPPSPTQRKIANFLDCKTQQINKLIRIKERRIELLQEQRTVLINQAVTKGLGPNVEMKPSEVEWIGRIPKDWNAVPLTKYLESIIDYRGRTPEKTEDGRFLVTAKNIRNGQIDYEISQEFTSEDEYQRIMTRGIPQIGDVLFTTEAPLGEVANVDDVSIALAQRIIKFQPKPDFLDPYFLKYWTLSYSFQSDLQRYATGSTAQGIKASKLCLLKLNLPPLKEQKQIVEYLDQKTQETNELITTEQRKIELLKEYRQSLISEVVTGKIDVRSEV